MSAKAGGRFSFSLVVVAALVLAMWAFALVTGKKRKGGVETL